MNKLKPCPFCGSQSVRKVTAPLRKTQMFICQTCGADVCFYGGEHEPKATEAWNRRATPECGELIERICANCDTPPETRLLVCGECPIIQPIREAFDVWNS